MLRGRQGSRCGLTVCFLKDHHHYKRWSVYKLFDCEKDHQSFLVSLLASYFADTAKFGRFHRGMLEQGVYLAPSQFEAGFTSLAHTEADVDRTIEAARSVLKSL